MRNFFFGRIETYADYIVLVKAFAVNALDPLPDHFIEGNYVIVRPRRESIDTNNHYDGEVVVIDGFQFEFEEHINRYGGITPIQVPKLTRHCKQPSHRIALLNSMATVHRLLNVYTNFGKLSLSHPFGVEIFASHVQHPLPDEVYSYLRGTHQDAIDEVRRATWAYKISEYNGNLGIVMSDSYLTNLVEVGGIVEHILTDLTEEIKVQKNEMLERVWARLMRERKTVVKDLEGTMKDLLEEQS